MCIIFCYHFQLRMWFTTPPVWSQQAASSHFIGKMLNFTFPLHNQPANRCTCDEPSFYWIASLLRSSLITLIIFITCFCCRCCTRWKVHECRWGEQLKCTSESFAAKERKTKEMEMKIWRDEHFPFINEFMSLKYTFRGEEEDDWLLKNTTWIQCRRRRSSVYAI